ncbi:MAG: Hsp20 family protein [Gammaproteobacteria bacterium]|nr:Hsp20 family protein [Gammaproteobacteria bacterium]
MKKILAITALLSSTLLNAHGLSQSNGFNHPMLNDGFWQDFNHQFQQFNRQMDRLQHSSGMELQSRQFFDKDSNSYVIEIKTMGLNKNNLNISNDKNTLIIEGYKQTSDNQNSRSEGSFSHMMSIPRDGDTNNISAAFKKGVLSVSIPKLGKPKPQIQKIKIR